MSGHVFQAFQLTAARRRLVIGDLGVARLFAVSTHSRPKAAGREAARGEAGRHVSTHSRPKAAGLTAILPLANNSVSTHSRPKAAGSSHMA